MALARFKSAVDYVAGYAKAFGNNTGWIQAVTVVDSTGADASATLPTDAATETTLAAASAKLPASLGIKTAANSLSIAPASDASFVAVGNVAHDAVDSGNPLKFGVRSTDTPAGITVANADRADALGNPNGLLYIAAGTGGQDAGGDGRPSLCSISTRLGASSTNTPLWTGGAVFNGTSWDRLRGDTTGSYVVSKGATTGGLSPARVLTGTTGVIKGSAGQLYKLQSVRNANAAVRYLHLYDKATAPTLSTDTPVLTISLLASSVQNGIDVGGDIGVAFANGISWAYTTDNIAIPTAAGTSTELMFSAAYK